MAWTMVLGPAVAKPQVAERVIRQVDLAPSIASWMGFECERGPGRGAARSSMAESPQALVRELAPKLPRTFVPSLNDQLRQWDTLFPAEQRTITAQLQHLARLPAPDFTELFAPVVALETRMNLPRLRGFVGEGHGDSGAVAAVSEVAYGGGGDFRQGGRSGRCSSRRIRA